MPWRMLDQSLTQDLIQDVGLGFRACLLGRIMGTGLVTSVVSGNRARGFVGCIGYPYSRPICASHYPSASRPKLDEMQLRLC